MRVELGEREAAFAWLERGLLDHSQAFGLLNTEPALHPLRGNPRFQVLAGRIEFVGPNPT